MWAVGAAIVAAVATAAAAVATAGTAYMCRTIEPYHMLWLVMRCMHQYQHPMQHTHDVAQECKSSSSHASSQPVDHQTSQSMIKSAHRTHQLHDQPPRQQFTHHTNQQANKSASRLTNKPDTTPYNKPDIPPVHQYTSKSTRKPVSQYAHQPTNHPRI